MDPQPARRRRAARRVMTRRGLAVRRAVLVVLAVAVAVVGVSYGQALTAPGDVDGSDGRVGPGQRRRRAGGCDRELVVHTERPDERVALTLRPAGARRTPCGRPPGCAGLAPEDVAAAIVANLGRASRTVWVPASMRCVMAALAITPRSIFRRLPL